MDLVPGTLELLILKTLSRGQAMHGFALLRWLHETTGGALLEEEGALYPALHRLEQRGLISGEWGVSEKGRRARYYGLTEAGRGELVRVEARWTQYLRAWQQITLAVSRG
ncbi:MAG: PadR family transcriptional regulator [Longimicrobiales bacterium]